MAASRRPSLHQLHAPGDWPGVGVADAEAAPQPQQPLQIYVVPGSDVQRCVVDAATRDGWAEAAVAGRRPAAAACIQSPAENMEDAVSALLHGEVDGGAIRCLVASPAHFAELMAVAQIIAAESAAAPPLLEADVVVDLLARPQQQQQRAPPPMNDIACVATALAAANVAIHARGGPPACFRARWVAPPPVPLLPDGDHTPLQ